MGWIDWIFVAIIAPPTLLWLYALTAVLRAMRGIPVLADDASPQPEQWPQITVLSPACNEAEHVEASISSLLEQDYPELRVVAINDRSTDGTGAILDRLAARDPRVTAVHIEVLPEGWLGKLNALKNGIEEATGDWLLFVDADIQFEPGALRRAVAMAEARGLDYLTVLPDIEPGGFALDATFNVSWVMVSAGGRPWAVQDPDDDAVAGVGAFIMMKRSLYEASEGLEWLRLEVADDVGMGLIAKRAGGRCAVALGRGMIRLAWYASLTDMIHKMQKNWFAIMGRFSLARLLAMACGTVWFACFPMAAALPVGELRWLALPGPMALVLATLLVSRWTGRPLIPAVFPQVGLLVTAWMMVRSGWIGHKTGGIAWRGQHYPTETLKPHQRVFL